MPPKKISQNDIIGQKGINFIERVVLDMGFVWHPTNLDAGIDGYIEIRDVATEEVTNCVVQVQSKATEGQFESETATSLTYICKEKDLQYWLSGNAPVILVRSRPDTNEGYWVSIKDYFKDPKVLATRKIVFDKTANRFDQNIAPQLRSLAIPKDSGLYLGNKPITETIYSDLVPVNFPSTLYVCPVSVSDPAEIAATLKDAGVQQREWILRSKTIISFHDLRDDAWSVVCDKGAVEQINTEEWSESKEIAKQYEFIDLLMSCLRSQLLLNGIMFEKKQKLFFFRADPDLKAYRYSYQSRKVKTSREVFSVYGSEDGAKVFYYRHCAFHPRFFRFDDQWYLQIRPTYHYTRDGWWVRYYKAHEMLTGMKRLENNQAVHGQVVMWEHLLTADAPSNASRPVFLKFQKSPLFELDAGIDESSWKKNDVISDETDEEAIDVEVETTSEAAETKVQS